jgi:hypothetical protein
VKINGILNYGKLYKLHRYRLIMQKANVYMFSCIILALALVL